MKNPSKKGFSRQNWFEIEPYSCATGESLQDLRDNLRLKKALKRAVMRDVAPTRLIKAIRTDIRA
jgi:hypothetical protein